MTTAYLRGQALIDSIRSAPYSRDLIGYHGQPPHPQWPNQARIAVQFVLNYEEGGENHIEHGDAGSEQFYLKLSVRPAFRPDICRWIRCMNMARGPVSGAFIRNFSDASYR